VNKVFLLLMEIGDSVHVLYGALPATWQKKETLSIMLA
jgi:hypothetical protein